jgi:hypothetical protein
MKGCLGVALIAVAAIGGGYAVYANPAVPAQAVHAEQQVAGWMRTHFAEFPATAPAPSAAGAAPPMVVATPSSIATSTPAGGAVWPANGGGGAPPASSAPPLTLVVPSPSPSTLPVSTWTSADCSWASAILRWDIQLDEAEAAAVANGTDTRFGSGPQLVAYYQAYAHEWGTVLSAVEEACNGGSVPTAARASDAVSWFGRATAAHGGDATLRPEDAQWDQEWIRYYARLSTMFAAASQ